MQRRILDESLRKVGTSDSAFSQIRMGFEKGSATPKKAHTVQVGRMRQARVHSWVVDYASAGKNACTEPVTIYRTGRPTKKQRKPLHEVSTSNPASLPVNVEMRVPCRKCANCLKRRAAHWYLRALTETNRAQRTWFGSLTLSPDQHVRVAAACRLQMARDGDDFDALPHAKQFAMRHKCINREITLYLKRLRKQSGAKFSFLCVVEEHTEKLTGLPHYHMLIHEAPGSSPVLHAVLSGQWRVGFSNWKLLGTPTKVGYVTAYLAKSMLGRVRPSIDYGQTSAGHSEA